MFRQSSELNQETTSDYLIDHFVNANEYSNGILDFPTPITPDQSFMVHKENMNSLQRSPKAFMKFEEFTKVANGPNININRKPLGLKSDLVFCPVESQSFCEDVYDVLVKSDYTLISKNEMNNRFVFHESFQDSPGSQLAEEYVPFSRISSKENDYKPAEYRGTSLKKEGRCPICVNSWFRIKQSTYWYHMNYDHGIKSNGEHYDMPVSMKRDSPNENVKALCGRCAEWVVLKSVRKQGGVFVPFDPEFKQWFKHQQKCEKYNQ